MVLELRETAICSRIHTQTPTLLPIPEDIKLDQINNLIPTIPERQAPTLRLLLTR